ncbi:hypothetical protein FRC11_008712 [Ceratobasidium sp. 423]|nr:hypothetical protein FRC11_008712 [Ceratobasidium sp. 423]
MIYLADLDNMCGKKFLQFIRRLFTSKAGAGRLNSTKSSVSPLTQKSVLSEPVVPDNNTQDSTATDLAVSLLPPEDDIPNNAPSDPSKEILHDAIQVLEDDKPRLSPADAPESGGVQNGCAPTPTFTKAKIDLGFPRESAQRSPQMKALLIGLDYKQCGKELHLRHATDDARRFAAALTKLGYTSENVRVVTDEGQSLASCEYLLECMDWLIDGASEEDRLFFMFSGHCLFPHGEKEPYLVAADEKPIPRSTFQERLVSKVPAGADLSIVLDCCHAAGMVKLKYRIGQMVPEAPASPICSVPHHGSLHGLNNVGPQASTLLPQAAPVMVNQVPFGTPTSTPSRRVIRGGIATAPPYPVIPNQGPAPARFASPIGAEKPGPAQLRQPMIQGRPLPQFQERKDDFVSPAGNITVWAGTGERLKAFEASGNVEGGIITNAICTILDKCLYDKVTQRDMWKSVVDAVDDENRCRRERDAKKPNFRNIPINTRIQLPELWVSQKEPLSSPSPILNQVVGCPWKTCE